MFGRDKRHTAHRIFERLRDEQGFTGGYTIVRNYVRARRQSVREAFVPARRPIRSAAIRSFRASPVAFTGAT